MNDLGTISPWLLVIAKAGVLAFILLCALIPISFISWLLHFSIADAFEQSAAHLRRWILKAQKLNLKSQARAIRLFKRHHQSNRFRWIYPDPVYPDPPHPVYSTIDTVEQQIGDAPLLAQNHERHKAEIVEKLNDNLTNLRQIQETGHGINVPELRMDPTTEIKAKEAKRKLWLCLPFLGAVIILNTMLLNVFFDEFFSGRKIILGISYSILISLMLSLIEAGIGLIIANSAQYKTSKVPIFTYILCSAGLLSLILVEFSLYLAAGLQMHRKSISDIADIYAEGLLNLLASGGWFAPLGPAIVALLYLLGHLVAGAYFEWSKQSQLKRFRDELDKSHEQAQSIETNMRTYGKAINEILGEIREADVRLNNIQHEVPAAVNEYKDTIETSLEKIRQQVLSVEEMRINPLSIQQTEVSKAETDSFFRVHIFYFIMLVASFFLMASFRFDDLPNGISNYLVATLLSAMFVYFGTKYATKRTVIRTNDDSEIATTTVQPPTPATFVGMGFGVVCVALFLWKYLPGPLWYSLFGITLLACFVCGTKLFDAIADWSVLFRVCLHRAKSVLYWLFWLFFQVCVLVLTTLSATLEALARPARHCFSGRRKHA